LLKDMGIKALFDKDKCDFSSLSDDKLACSQVRHVTKLQVDKKGIEGAAVTIIQMDGMPAPEFEEVYLDFAVDRAFGFIITDGDGVQLFSGAVNKV
ncbi:MAG: serpin family protein, partial [Clostridia bacterium]|nr:serpin family protein [Clostridia bacterium]